MQLETLKAYCIGKQAATSDFPFGPETQVYRVMGKIFALVALTNTPLSINLKCDPTLAEILRQTYPAVIPGYHMNKRHWNTVILDGSIPEAEVYEMIDQSYELIVKSLPRTQREQLKD